ncbi:MAG: hypothetical protein IPL39_13065 [Opitutaceae bacterium]|nr:hypothetical protein [Opitutaceae bacterium]
MSALPSVQPPPSVAARCSYAAHLGSAVLALAFTALACGAGQPLLLLHALLAATASALFRAALAESGQLTACTEEDTTPVPAQPGLDSTQARKAAALRQRCAELEGLRGTPRFDPWQTLDLRRQLSALREHRDGKAT